MKIGEAAVYRFFVRTTRRTQWPAGFEPDAAPATAAPDAVAAVASGAGLFGPTKGKAKQTALAAAAPKEPEKPRPYRSQMLPHLAFIKEQRRGGESWRQIAQALESRKGVRVSYQAVAEFYARTQSREHLAAAKQQAGLAPSPFAPSQTSPGLEDDPVKQFLS